MIVIVTGALGFIGSHTVEILLASGYTVVGIDDFSTGSLSNLVHVHSQGVRIVRADVADFGQVLESLRGLVAPGDVEAVIHLAAMTNVVEVWDNPQRALDVNVKGTLNVLELSRRLDIGRVVYASSVAVYGEPRYLPIDEDHPLEPINLYGETKLMGERLLHVYMKAYGIKPIALRYFNVYGPRMRPGPYAGVIHQFITRLLRGEPPIIYGDGNQTRDFIYVEDVAKANTKALETQYTGALNIGTGRETSINKLYKLICSIIGNCPEPVHEKPRLGDIRRSKASIEKATRILGWRPETSLEEGLRKTINHYVSAINTRH